MNILFSCDDKAYPGLRATIYSILYHTKEPVNFYVFTMTYERFFSNGGSQRYDAITDDHVEETKKLVKYMSPWSNVVFYNGAEYYSKYFLHGVDENDGHSSPYAPLRLVIDIAFPYLMDMLYLDVDIIVQEDLAPMYHYYLDTMRQNKKAMAGFPNPLSDGRKELVASVLLFDIPEARKQKIFEKARYNITHNHYQWYDQSALEEACPDYVELPETYNFMKEYHTRTYTPAIMHFACDLNPKIYFANSEDEFYKKYPHLEYIQKGIKRFQSIGK